MVVDAASQSPIRSSALYAQLEQSLGCSPLEASSDGEGLPCTVPHQTSQGCAFLLEDRLCGLHAEGGESLKPAACRLFPFLPKPTPDGVVVGVSYFCSAVQRNEGRLLAEHAQDLEALVAQLRPSGVGHRPIPLTHDISLSWVGYQRFEQVAQSALGHPSLEEAMWHIFLGSALMAHHLGTLPRPNPRLASALIPSFREDELGQALETMPVVVVGRDAVYESLGKTFVTAILATLESSDPTSLEQATHAFAEDGLLQSPSFGCTLDLGALKAWRAQFEGSVGSAHEALYRRYLEQLLFRKMLACDRPLVENAAALWMIVPLLDFYRDAAAFLAGRTVPDKEDVYRALDAVELGFANQTRLLAPFFEALAHAMMTQLQAQLGS